MNNVLVRKIRKTTATNLNTISVSDCQSTTGQQVTTRYRNMLEYIRVSNRSAGMISSRFPGDIFTKTEQNLQFYRHLPGRVTNPWDHTDPVYPSNSSVKGHIPGIDSTNIN